MEGSRRFDPGGGNLGSVPKNVQIHTEFWAVISGPADIGVWVADTGSIAVRRYKAEKSGGEAYSSVKNGLVNGLKPGLR